MRRNRVRISTIRLYAYKCRYSSQTHLKEESEDKSATAELETIKNQELNELGHPKVMVFKRKLFARVQRKIRNIKNAICFCFYRVGEIFGQTFCFIILGKTKSTGILKSVRV